MTGFGIELLGEVADAATEDAAAVPTWVGEFALVSVLAMGLLSFALGAGVGFLHRTYANARVPFYAPMLVGLGAVGLWINSASALVMVIQSVGDEAAEPFVLANAEVNLVTAVVAAIAAYGGGRVGDRLAPELRALTGARQVDTEVSKLVRSVGRVITVEIPETIHPMDGYDPITDETRAELAGREFVFPRGLTVDQLRERIVERLRGDYGIGYVDIELDRDGEITHLGLGRRVAGIGPTLPPRRVAVAVNAHPPPTASPGDVVQLWELPSPEADPTGDGATPPAEGGSEPGSPAADGGTPANGQPPAGVREPMDLPEPLRLHPERWYRPESDEYAFAVRLPDGGRRYRRTAESAATLVAELYGRRDGTEVPAPPSAKRVAQAELRAANGDVATIVVDVTRLASIDQSKEYRLVTLPSTKRPEQEFASLLRTANETMETVEVVERCPVVGVPIGALRPRIVAIRPGDGPVETLPADHRQCAPGDTLYAVGRPEQLRKLVAAGGA